MDELRNEIMNFADTGNEQEYNEQDVNAERRRAEDAIRVERDRAVSIHKPVVDDLSLREINEIKKQLADLRKENDDLKGKVTLTDSETKGIKGDLYNQAIRQVMGEIDEEKKGLKNNEDYSDLYDDDALTLALQNNAKVGKVLSPKEQLSILAFDKVIEENKKLKAKIGNRNKILGTPIGMSSSNTRTADGPPDVTGLSYDEGRAKIRHWQMQELERQGL
jgi:hypothetical protein